MPRKCSLLLCWRRSSLKELGLGGVVLGLAVFVFVLILHFYWVQFGVRQDHTVFANEKAKSSPVYLFRALGGLHSLRGSVVSNVRGLVKFSLSACSHFKIECFLDAGTLLGAYREGKVFDWEEDADLGFMKEDFDRLRELEKSGKLKAFSHSFFKEDNFDIIFRDGENHIMFRAVDRSSHLYVDFNMFNKEKEGLFESPYSWSYPHCAHCLARRQFGGPKKVSMPLSDVFPLKPCNLEGMQTLCPHDTVKYLEYQFGATFNDRPIEFRVSTKVLLYLFMAVFFLGSVKAVTRCIDRGMSKGDEVL